VSLDVSSSARAFVSRVGRAWRRFACARRARRELAPNRRADRAQHATRGARAGALIACFAGAAALSATVGRAQATGGAQPFSRDERARLVAGELVRRPEQRRESGGTYIGGLSWQRVRAPRERVWQTIVDASLYPRLIPAVERADVVEDEGSHRLMRMRHGYLFVHVGYFANVEVDPDSYTIRFDLDSSRPHDVRDGRGFIRLEPYGRDETIVTWGVRADVGAGILTGVFAGVIHDWILRVPYCVRAQVEGLDETC
jgi:carbon monoxide dehydrogenase subunit G